VTPTSVPALTVPGSGGGAMTRMDGGGKTMPERPMQERPAPMQSMP
jgi:hypothetical protein